MLGEFTVNCNLQFFSLELNQKLDHPSPRVSFLCPENFLKAKEDKESFLKNERTIGSLCCSASSPEAWTAMAVQHFMLLHDKKGWKSLVKKVTFKSCNYLQGFEVWTAAFKDVVLPQVYHFLFFDEWQNDKSSLLCWRSSLWVTDPEQRRLQLCPIIPPVKPSWSLFHDLCYPL